MSDIQDLTEEQLAGIIGPTAMREYQAAADYDKPEIRSWAATLRDLSDSEFISECASKILESASVIRFRDNWEGVHARASACHHESRRRHAKAGHAEDCSGDTLHTKGYNRAYRSQGYTPPGSVPCSCGAGQPLASR